ncbi:MAG: phage Gp37/Gp68 family protein [Thiotrichaceae bacterium]
MGTKIEWCEETWNPISGCTKVSEGCQNCYAEKMAGRIAAMLDHKAAHKYASVVTSKGKWSGEIYCDEKALDKPLHWRKPRRIFVCSMSDLFHHSVPFEFIEKVLRVIEQCDQHTFLVLTKRPKVAYDLFGGISGAGLSAPPLKNLWLGVTAENQKRADERIPILLQIPAAKRFVSIEPCLSKITFDNKWLTGYNSEHESKTERNQSVSGGGNKRIIHRQTGQDLETQSEASRQMERGKSCNSVQTKTSRTRQWGIPAGKNDDRWKKTSRSRPSTNMVSSSRNDTDRADNKPQEREKERQSPIESGISNLSGTGIAFNKGSGSHIQQRQSGKISWIIVGGESGPGARPMHPDWVRSIRDQCEAVGVPFFFKQWGAWGKPIYRCGHIDFEIDSKRLALVDRKGNWHTPVSRFAMDAGRILAGERLEIRMRVGKKKAGHLLDGKVYRQWPERAEWNE